MKKHKQSNTAYIKDKREVNKLSDKIAKLLEDSVPKNLLGMLATAKENEDSLTFYDRWQLIVHGKNDYAIYDKKFGDIVYNHIALFSSVVNIIFHLNNKITGPSPLDKTFYELDQEYYRCLEDIKFYRAKKKTKDTELSTLFSIRLIDRHQRLEDVKMKLSKLN